MLPDFLSYELFPTVLNMSLTASVVILAVLLARLLLRRAPKVCAYALWAVVLFRLACPVSLTAGFSLLNLVDAPVQEAAGAATVVAYVPRDVVHTPYPQVELPVPGVSQAVNEALPQGEEQTVADPLEAPVAIATLVWLAGVLGMGAYSALSLVGLRRRLVGAVPLEGNVYLADHIPTPFVLGVLRPKIYLPSSLPERERGYILLHERHHIRRLDHLVKLLAYGVLCVHWFNPLVWAAFLLMGRDMEMSCDEAVMKKLGEGVRADYSASLLALATGRRILAGAPLAFGEGDAGSRVRNVLKWKRPKGWAVLLGAAACVAVIAACAANPAAEPEEARTGGYASMVDYVQQVMEDTKTISYRPVGGDVASANVLDVKLEELVRRGEVDNLAPDGVLELWEFNLLYQTDAPAVELRRTGLPEEEEGWFALDGSSGHRVVGLRYEDGSYDILYDQLAESDPGFTAGYLFRDSQALHDWYIREMGLDLPLYLEDWGNDSFALRYDGEGWYLYVPLAGWENQVLDDGSVTWRSAYGTGGSLTVGYAQNAPAQDEEAGVWVYPAPEGGAYVVQAAWPGAGDARGEAAQLRRMAESFVVDRSITGVLPPSAADLSQALGTLVENGPITLQLRQDGGVTGSYGGCWGVSNALYYLGRLQSAAWELWPDGTPSSTELAGRAQVILSMGAGDGGTLTAYEGLEAARFSAPGGEVWVRPAAGEEQPALSVYEDLRGWYDEVEFAALGAAYGQDQLAVPNQGQTYLEAAEAFVQEWEGRRLQVSQGSKYGCTFVETSVEDAPEETQYLRETGELGESGYCFRFTTVFVPENDRAQEWMMAGNTRPYDGGSPEVPDGALAYDQYGTITLEDGAWRGEILGTGI